MKSTQLQEESNVPFSPGSSHRKQGKAATKTCLPEITVLSARDRLKRHREEVAGKVPIPESWGKEGMLMGWMDFSVFDGAFTSTQIVSARAVLMANAGDDTGAIGTVPSSCQLCQLESSC